MPAPRAWLRAGSTGRGQPSPPLGDGGEPVDGYFDNTLRAGGISFEDPLECVDDVWSQIRLPALRTNLRRNIGDKIGVAIQGLNERNRSVL